MTINCRPFVDISFQLKVVRTVALRRQEAIAATELCPIKSISVSCHTLSQGRGCIQHRHMGLLTSFNLTKVLMTKLCGNDPV
jgi:hypothetical protein